MTICTLDGIRLRWAVPLPRIRDVDCWMQPCAAGHLKYFATIRHLRREHRGSLDWLPRPRPDDSGPRRHRADLSWSVGPPSPQEFCKRHWQRRMLKLTHRLGRLLSGSVLKLGAFQFQRVANLNAALPNTSRTLKPVVHLTGCHWHRGTRVNFKPKQKQFLSLNSRNLPVKLSAPPPAAGHSVPPAAARARPQVASPGAAGPARSESAQP